MISFESVDTIFQEAAQQGKPALLFILGGEWCKWCMKLKKAINDHPEFLAALHAEGVRVGFVQVERKADDRSGIRERFGVKSIPYTALISPDGTIEAATEFIGDGQGEDEGVNLGLCHVAPKLQLCRILTRVVEPFISA